MRSKRAPHNYSAGRACTCTRTRTAQAGVAQPAEVKLGRRDKSHKKIGARGGREAG